MAIGERIDHDKAQKQFDRVAVQGPDGDVATFKNADLVTLDDPRQGAVVLDYLKKMLEKGDPLDTACRALRLDRPSLERLRRGTSPWSRHVNNTINMAEAEFERVIIRELLQSKDAASVKKAETYIAAFKPRFAAAQKLRIEYEVNYLLEAVRRHVDEDTWLKVLDEVAGFDSRVLVQKLDEHLLPRVG